MQTLVVRVDPKQLGDAKAKAEEMSREMGLKVSVSDVVRIALGRFLNGTPVK